LLGGAQQREGLARIWLYHARRRSRLRALPVTLDESDAEVRFQSTQVLGDGRLADVASLGGAAHPAWSRTARNSSSRCTVRPGLIIGS